MALQSAIGATAAVCDKRRMARSRWRWAASAGLRQPALPGVLRLTRRHVVRVPHERELEQSRVTQQATHDSRLVRREVRQSLLAIAAAFSVQQRGRAEPVDESLELAAGDGLLPQVDVVNDDPALAEEAQGVAGRGGIVGAEHLDVRHLL